MALAMELLREAGQRVQIPLDLGLGHERAAAPADRPDHEATSSERVERLSKGHATHLESLGELALGRKAVSRFQITDANGPGDSVFDLRIGGCPRSIEPCEKLSGQCRHATPFKPDRAQT